jgi:23S rRNA (cytosine1962-C5)-methyltransferase
VFSHEQYALLDFGEGRKLERFGDVIVDRPSPAVASARRRNESAWSRAAARFIPSNQAIQSGCGQRGQWQRKNETPDRWIIEHGALRFELRLTEFGHVGVFPEQASNWDRIAKHVLHLGSQLSSQSDTADNRPRVLNLFAYTGGSTLAAAAGGAEVVHVDASKSTVAWARQNAELSGLAAAPIRWIAEDAARFVARELKRGRRYHGIILDPPSYGHGPKGRSWLIDRDLPSLLQVCSELLTDEKGFVLLSCHSPAIGVGELTQLLENSMRKRRSYSITFGCLNLRTFSGRQIPSGVMAQWEGR